MHTERMHAEIPSTRLELMRADFLHKKAIVPRGGRQGEPVTYQEGVVTDIVENTLPDGATEIYFTLMFSIDEGRMHVGQKRISEQEFFAAQAQGRPRPEHSAPVIHHVEVNRTQNALAELHALAAAHPNRIWRIPVGDGAIMHLKQVQMIGLDGGQVMVSGETPDGHATSFTVDTEELCRAQR